MKNDDKLALLKSGVLCVVLFAVAIPLMMHFIKVGFGAQGISYIGLGVAAVIYLFAFRMLGKTLGLLFRKFSNK